MVEAARAATRKIINNLPTPIKPHAKAWPPLQVLFYRAVHQLLERDLPLQRLAPRALWVIDVDRGACHLYQIPSLSTTYIYEGTKGTNDSMHRRLGVLGGS